MSAFTARAVSRWRHLTAVLGLSAFLAAAWAPTPVRAQLFGDDEARRAILDLRKRVEEGNEAQRKVMAEQNAALTEQLSQLRRSLLELSTQIDLMRADMAKMRGQEEQLTRAVAELQSRQKDIQQGVDERIRRIEPQSVTVDGIEFKVEPEERRLYEEAMALIRNGSFVGAAQAFTAFQNRYPTSGYAQSVLFWLGNAQYGKRDYKEAINTFRSLVAMAPQGPRAPEALLSMANCQAELKDPRSARRTLEDLIKTYPDSEAAQAARERLVALR